MFSPAVHSYGLNGMADEAIELYRRMPVNLINDRTHVCVLNACSHSGLLSEARQIFADAPKKTEMIYTTMVSGAVISLLTVNLGNRWIVAVGQLRLTKPKHFFNSTKWNIPRLSPCTVSLVFEKINHVFNFLSSGLVVRRAEREECSFS